MLITSPQNDDEFSQYYDLRWRVLRAPWGEPRGSERDELEDAAVHAVAWQPHGVPLAVGRLHFNSAEEAQIRFMAVAPEARRRGLGSALVAHFEEIARQRGAAAIVLNSRQEAVGFYQRLGYEVIAAGPTMFGSVAHCRLSKRLT